MLKKTNSANVQLLTRRQDSADGFKSKSYGNQKFDFKLDGTFRNELTGFCVTAHERKKATDGTNWLRREAKGSTLVGAAPAPALTLLQGGKTVRATEFSALFPVWTLERGPMVCSTELWLEPDWLVEPF